ncbi:hypothetical protein [Croceimicrobium hydrocarbonivorans]|uniref:Uncharacterized protein n=1 Tax=Croceimicrobium hydrocarbonivorans TaxID=2761580 RepID=A0A7H0VCD8_9FLAO|nr:hypothetical protein [Croceimicrobium hydrocarbonivorans]QNR23386.1 hypothetical protein H4K34_13495 [Croceimicrobium hydrocarbonivorans]
MNFYLIKIVFFGIAIFVYFWRREQAREAKERQSFYFNPDPNSILRLLPVENRMDLKEEFRQLHLNSGKGSKPYLSEAGFRFPEPSHPILDRKITKDSLSKVLGQANLPVRFECSTGDQAGDFMLKKSHGYGWNGQGICFTFNKENLVNEIWIAGDLASVYPKMKPVLLDLGKKWNLLLADSKRQKTISLSNEDALDEYYFREEEEVRSRMS